MIFKNTYTLRIVRRYTTNIKAPPSPNNEANSLMTNALFWAHFLPPMSLMTSTMYRHFTQGPPAKSWSLPTELTITFLRDLLYRSSKITVEDIQRLSTNKSTPIPSSIRSRRFKVPNSYRAHAGKILSNIFSPLEKHQIGWDWQHNRDKTELKGEWLQEKGNPLDPRKENTLLYLHGGAYYIGCYGIYRQFLSRFLSYSKGRTCSIDYRLAPQSPFPAAVEDALATYLYLIDPPRSEPSSPIDPKKIVIAGDSAGGGLTFALLLAIRDGQLPLPAGGMTLSAWLDLTHSLPSIMTNIMTDYLPPVGFRHAPSPALDYEQLPILKSLLPEDQKLDTFGDDLYRLQFYAPNKALKNPMVSPLFDKKHLRGLPRLLMQCGEAERLYDESVYGALLASNQYNTSTEKPTQIRLETYTDQPHVFQLLFPNKSTLCAIKSLARFFCEVTQEPSVQQDDLQVFRTLPNGKTTEFKDTLLNEINRNTFYEWSDLLERRSMKARMDQVEAAYQKIIEQLEQ